MKSRDMQIAEAVRDACEAMHETEDVLASIGNSAYGEAYQDGWIEGTEAYRAAIQTANLQSIIDSVPAPEPVEEWREIEQIANARYRVVSSDKSMFWRFAVVAGDGSQQLYIGRELECTAMASRFAGAFLDGAFMYQKLYTAPSAAEINVQLLDALRAALIVIEGALYCGHVLNANGVEKVQAIRTTIAAAEKELKYGHG